MFWEALLMWSSMPSFSFIGHTLTELFRKLDNWQQIYKSTAFYIWKDLSRRKNNYYVIARLQNSCLIAIAVFKKYRSSQRRCRNIHQRYSVKKVFLKISQISQENTWIGVFFDKVEVLQSASFLRKRLQHKCFPVNFAKLLRIKNICK